MSATIAQMSSGRTVGARTVVTADQWYVSVIRLSVPGDCTPSVPWPRVQCTPPLYWAHLVVLPTMCVSPRGQSPAGCCWRFLLWWPCNPPTPEPRQHAVLIPTSQWIKQIYQCQLYASISAGLGVGGSITIRRIGRGFSVAVAAGAWPSMDCFPKQLCSLHSQGNSGSQSNQLWAPQYWVHLFPNTGPSSSKPPLCAASSVQ